MATVTNHCNQCGKIWAKKSTNCPKCNSEDFIIEWDEEDLLCVEVEDE